jgi:hypothetical protein
VQYAAVSRLERARLMRSRRHARAEQWMRSVRTPLRRALAEIMVADFIAFHWLRHLLIKYFI